MNVDPDPEIVATRIDRWLRVERWTTHNGGHNSVLDDYEKTRLLYLPRADGGYVNKADGHYSRFVQLMDRLSGGDELTPQGDEDPYADDTLVATIGHHGLMFAAGAFRFDCNVRARNSWEYDAMHIGWAFRLASLKRQNPPVSIDLVPAVSSGFDVAQSFTPGKESKQIQEYGQAANRAIYNALSRAQIAATEANAQPGITLPDDHVAVLEARTAQYRAVALVAAHFAVATALRKDAGHELIVPIFQPDSITKVRSMELVDILAPNAPRYTFEQAQE